MPEPSTPSFNQRFDIAFAYPVHFTRGLLQPGNTCLPDTLDRLKEGRCHRVAVIVDSGVSDARPAMLEELREVAHAHRDRMELAGPPLILPGGEAVKNGWKPVRNVMTTLGDLHLDRQSFVLAIGGGSLLDMVGFATSIVHRGLRLVRVPTTTLAQNDAGVGVKNGMNEHGQKNFVGTFAPPFAVINDAEFLTTLPPPHWIGGVAEAFKVAIIKDADLFGQLCDDAEALAGRDLEAMARAVHRCAVLHLEHIRTSGDPFEFGSARPLDFGHWAGHRLEVLSDYHLGHGQATAVGIAIDSVYAAANDLLADAELEAILTGLERCGLPTWSDLLDRRTPGGNLDILAGLEQFREHLGGELTVTLPAGIGERIEVHHMSAEAVADAIGTLRQRTKQDR
ncbi:MAG: 3-dehydroquinate synthase [Planctomycetes bacterium]|jgi:3-dehydroquinate synthase|nr:3-dehydroquinate synthase [Planctomycetota bacterium]